MKQPSAEAADAARSARFKRWHSGIGVVLSALSCALVFYTAGQEPYITFRWSDLALNIGVGAILFVSFAVWGLIGVRNFRAARRSSLATALLCASLAWAAINLFYLGQSICGYAQDLRNPRLHALR